MRFFLDRAPLMMGTVALTPDGDLLHLYDNPATTRFFGLEPGRTEGRTARSLGVPEAFIALWRDRYEQAWTERRHVSFEYEHPLPAGPRTILATVSPLERVDHAGRPQLSYIAEDVTARRRAEAARAESEASLRAVFDQAAAGLALVALDGRWLRVNRRLCEILGYTEAEFAALTFQDTSNPEDLEADLANVQRLIAGEAATYAMEKRYYRKDGSEVWANLTVSLLRDADGRPDRFISVVEDITGRKMTEAALGLAQHRLAMATRASGLGVWEWVHGSEAVHYSGRAREICGFAPDEPITLARVLEATHPDDLATIRERTAATRNDEAQASVEYRIVHPTRGVRWVRAFSTATLEDGGQPARLFGTLEDITEQKAMQEKLTASEARLRLALDAGRMAVFQWPLDDPQPPMTPALRAQLRIPEGQASTVEERRARYHPDDAALASSTRQRALESQDRFLDFVFRYFWPDGQMRWLQVRSEIIRSEAGKPQSLVGVQLDITEQRENEERLRLLMREVDHRANNLLAVVQSFVALSKAEDAGALRTVLSGRIAALSRAHQLLSETRWAGADLKRLTEEELRPYGLEEDGRIRLSGEAVSLSPAQAQALGLALHELATNAAKYGALSQAGGELAIAWEVGDDGLVMHWRERGGPLVRAPGRRGFGTTIIDRSLGGPLGGRVEMDWAGTGLTAALHLPLETPGRD